jgi:hypothetical protein
MSTSGDGSDRDVRERLRQLRLEPPDDGFEARLRQRLVAAGPPEAPSPWQWLRAPGGGRRWLWPAGGLAAGVAAFLLLAFLRGAPGPARPTAGEALAAAEVPASKVAVVRVNLSAAVAVESADIRVTLPEGLVFWSEGQALAQRSFEWRQPLEPGSNEIPIAVRGQRPGLYHVRVTALVGGTWIDHDVPIAVVKG